MNILVACAVTKEHKRRIMAAARDNEVIFCDGSLQGFAVPVDEHVLAGADIIIGNIAPALLRHARQLKWLQLNSAGAGSYCVPGLLPEDVILTNATGAYGIAVAEHMTAQVLMMMKRLPAYYDNQKEEIWRDEGVVGGLFGATVVVIGYGDIGSTFGKQMQGFGAHVIGIRRRSTAAAPGADEMGTMERLDDYLSRADVVAAALPDTEATRGLFTAERFAAMKKGVYFINAGRGNAVDQDALCDALTSGQIGGAALDVTEPEPLPRGHRLWKTKGLYITPHVSGGLHLKYTHDMIIDIAVRNLRAFLADCPLINEVDLTTGYKKQV